MDSTSNRLRKVAEEFGTAMPRTMWIGSPCREIDRTWIMDLLMKTARYVEVLEVSRAILKTQLADSVVFTPETPAAEIERLQREISERRTRLAMLVLGDPRCGVTGPDWHKETSAALDAARKLTP